MTRWKHGPVTGGNTRVDRGRTGRGGRRTGRGEHRHLRHVQHTPRRGSCRKRPGRAHHDSFAAPTTASTSGARSCGMNLSSSMSRHQVVIAGAGPTGLMLAAELTLAGIDAVVVERRATQNLESSRSRGLHARTIEVLDQRGVADRFLAEGQAMQVQAFAGVPLDISDFPSRHPYGLALYQSEFERILAAWVDELGAPIIREREVTGFVAGRRRRRGRALQRPVRAGPVSRRAATGDAAWCERRRGSSSPAGIRPPAG